MEAKFFADFETWIEESEQLKLKILELNTLLQGNLKIFSLKEFYIIGTTFAGYDGEDIENSFEYAVHNFNKFKMLNNTNELTLDNLEFILVEALSELIKK
jgi:hypothetical protein